MPTPRQMEMGRSAHASPAFTDAECDGASVSGNNPDGGPKRRSETLWGIQRRMLFIIMGIGALVVVCAVGIGVGAGIAFNRSSSGDIDTSSDE